MAGQPSPFNASDTVTCSNPGYPSETLKRKRSISGLHPAREYGLMRDSGGHDVPRFIGSSSGIFYIRAVYLRLAKRSASRTEAAAKSNLVPGEDDQLAPADTTEFYQNKRLWRPEEVVEVAEGTPLQADFEDFINWSKSYFELWHSSLPFLDGPEVLQTFEKASRGGISSLTSLEQVIVKSILSISLADSRQGPTFKKPIPTCFVFPDIEAAVASSQFALTQPASIKATQAALSIQLFLISMLRLNAASRLGGLIVRMAFHLGLHRCPTRFPFFTPDVALIRRRVFWCVYILERMLCQFLGLPLDIQDDDLDICYPDEEIHGGSERAEDTKRLVLLTCLAKHARIRGLILELRNKAIPKRHDTADREAFVQTELAKWSNEVQDIVEDGTESETASEPEAEDRSTISPCHQMMLLVLQHESTIGLNRPSLASESASISYASAFQSCVSAAKSICLLFRQHRRTFRLSSNIREMRLSMPLLWPSFTFAVWISAFVLIHAAFEQQVSLDSALRHVKAGKDMLSHLAMRGTSWPEYCKEAIDELMAATMELSHSRDNNQMVDLTEDPTSNQRTQGGEYQFRPQKRQSITTRTARGSGSRPDTNIPAAQTNIQARESRNISRNGESTQRRTSGVESLQDVVDWRQHTTPATQRLQDQFLASGSSGLDYEPNLSNPTTAGHEIFDESINVDLEAAQQPMMWYDQLFASSFSAIDNPFLVAAEFDASIDPTWNYLT